MSAKGAPVAVLVAQLALLQTQAGVAADPPAAVHAVKVAELARWHATCPPSRCADPHLNVMVDGRFALVDWTNARGSGQSVLENAPRSGWYRLSHGAGDMGEGILAALIGDAAALRLWRRHRAARGGSPTSH